MARWRRSTERSAVTIAAPETLATGHTKQHVADAPRREARDQVTAFVFQSPMNSGSQFFGKQFLDARASFQLSAWLQDHTLLLV